MSALLAMAAAASQLGDGFVQFSRTPALDRTRVTVAIGVLQHTSATAEPVYWARRTAGGFETWIDGRTCPSLREALAAMQTLPAPVPDIPSMGTVQPAITLDGVRYRLTFTALYGRNTASATYESNVGTPLAIWVEDSLKRFEPCWNARVPQRG